MSGALMGEQKRNPLKDRLDTLIVHPEDRKVLDRIAKRFDSVADDGRGCMLLTGASNRQGRPRIWVDGVNTKCAKIIVALRDDKPWWSQSWQTRHLCDNPACVNPDHLTYGTAQDDADDRVEAGNTTRGERNRHAKLTEEQALAILHASGTQAEIAEWFGISTKQVGKIKRGEAWAHLQATSDEHTSPRGGFAGIETGSTEGQFDGR